MSSGIAHCVRFDPRAQVRWPTCDPQSGQDGPRLSISLQREWRVLSRFSRSGLRSIVSELRASAQPTSEIPLLPEWATL